MQFVQGEDTRFPFAYFTVLAALLIAITPLLAAAGLRMFGELTWISGAAGALLSGTVYWLVLAPTNGVGSLWATVGANTVLHAVLPLSAVHAILTRHRPKRARRSTVLATLCFPAAYLSAVLAGQILFQQRAPYEFMDVCQSGWLVVAVSSVSIGLLYLITVLLLLRLQTTLRS